MNTMGEDLCPICLDVCDVKKQTYRLPCDHTMHTECAINWFRSRGSASRCPVCRSTTLQADDIESESGAEENASDSSNGDLIGIINSSSTTLLKAANSRLSEHVRCARKKTCSRQLHDALRRFRKSRDNLRKVNREHRLFFANAYGSFKFLRKRNTQLSERVMRAKVSFACRFDELLEVEL